MEEKKYVLTLRFEFEEVDDVEARKVAEGMLWHLGEEPSPSTIKLQELRVGREPRGVRLPEAKTR